MSCYYEDWRCHEDVPYNEINPRPWCESDDMQHLCPRAVDTGIPCDEHPEETLLQLPNGCAVCPVSGHGEGNHDMLEPDNLACRVAQLEEEDEPESRRMLAAIRNYLGEARAYDGR